MGQGVWGVCVCGMGQGVWGGMGQGVWGGMGQGVCDVWDGTACVCVWGGGGG